MMVGSVGTGDALYGPLPSGIGMQEGTYEVFPCCECHSAILKLSQPQPGPEAWSCAGTGFHPGKPSEDAATSWMCATQLDASVTSNVRSEITKFAASLDRAGISQPGYWE